MARPRKNIVTYFPHDCNHSRTLYILDQKFGNDGYAFYFRLMELLGLTDGHSYDCSNKAEWRYLLTKTNVEENLANDIIALLIELGEINKGLWKLEKRIWWQPFVDLLEDAYSRRINAIPTMYNYISPKGVTANRNEVNVNTNGINVNRNPQSKVKDSKVNKNRGEESRGSLSDEDLNELQIKYPKVTVNDSYDRFVNHHKSKGTYFADVEAGFDNWLKQDEEWDKNPRKKENSETLFYCINNDCDLFGKTKQLKNDIHLINPFCDSCTHQMGRRYEYDLALDRKAVKEKNFHYE